MSDVSGPLAWGHEVGQISGSGLTRTRVGSASERTGLAAALDIASIDRLEVRYTLKPFGKGRYRLTGEIEADVAQACVVTLEPVAEAIREPFDIEFVPPDVMESLAGGEAEREILTAPDLEPLEGHTIDVGRIVFEIVSANLDPYPRRPGAEFDWNDPLAEASKAAGGAFAALAKLKKDE